NLEEVVPRHLRVVFVINQVAGGEVDRSQVRCKRRNVDAEKIVQNLPMFSAGHQLAFARIGAYQKGSTTAGRIHNRFVSPANAKTVDEIHDLDSGIVLTVLLALL